MHAMETSSLLMGEVSILTVRNGYMGGSARVLRPVALISVVNSRKDSRLDDNELLQAFQALGL